MNALNSLLIIVKGLGEKPKLSASERARMQSFEEEVHMALGQFLSAVESKNAIQSQIHTLTEKSAQAKVVVEKGEQIEKNLDSVEVKINTLKSQITKLQEELADAEKQREELTQSFDSLQRLLSEEKNSRKWFRWGIFLFIGSNERWKSRCFWRGISTRCSPLVEYGSSFPFFREPTEDQTKSRAVKPPFSTYCHFLPTTGEQNRSYPAASLAIPPFISPRLSSVAVFSPSLDTFLL